MAARRHFSTYAWSLLLINTKGGGNGRFLEEMKNYLTCLTTLILFEFCLAQTEFTSADRMVSDRCSFS